MDKINEAKKHLRIEVTKAFVPAFICIFVAITTFVLATRYPFFYILNIVSLIPLVFILFTTRSNTTFFTRLIKALDRPEPKKYLVSIQENMSKNLEDGEFNNGSVATGFYGELNKKGQNKHIEREIRVLKEVIEILN